MDIKDLIITKLKEQIELCNKKMLEINDNQDYDLLLSKLSDYNNLFNPDVFLKVEELIKKECIDKDRRDQLITDLSTINDVLKIMSISPEEERVFREDEVVRYKRIIDFISEIKNNANSNSSEFESLQTMCYAIIDKIEGYPSSRKMITAEEVGFISDLFDNSKLYGNVLVFIDKLVHSAYDNIVDYLQNGGTLDDVEDVNRDNPKKLERSDVYNILSRYFTDADVINKIIDEFDELILRRGDLNNISAIVDYLLVTIEYDFLKGYGLKNTNSSNKGKMVRDITREIRTLSTLFTYSSVDILKLIERDVSNVVADCPLKGLFDTVPGIYRPGKIKEGEPKPIIIGGRPRPDSDDGISGSFDTYLENKKIFGNLSSRWFNGQGIDVFEQIVEFSPSCLDIPSESLRKEIDIYELYKIEKLTDAGRIKSAGFISSTFNKYLESADRMIEAGDDCFEYLRKFPTAFKHDKSNLIVYIKKQYPEETWFNERHCKKKAYGKLEQEMKEKGIYYTGRPTADDVTSLINNDYRTSVNKFISEKIKLPRGIDLSDYTKSNDRDNYGIIEWLEAKCLGDNQYTYKIGDILISRLKFNRVFNTLTSNAWVLENNSLNDTVLYALSYGSLLTSEEFECLRTFANGFVFEKGDTPKR